MDSGEIIPPTKADIAFGCHSQEPFRLPEQKPLTPPGFISEKDYLFLRDIFNYQPAKIIRWEWSNDWNRWKALVEFADGKQLLTVSHPEILERH